MFKLESSYYVTTLGLFSGISGLISCCGYAIMGYLSDSLTVSSVGEGKEELDYYIAGIGLVFLGPLFGLLILHITIFGYGGAAVRIAS